ncbi:MAG: heparinase II/III family protein, partial [Candidatus Firestonebacteria bacterium]
KTRNGSNSMMRAFDFLYGNVKETPLDLKNLPLAHLVKDAGKVYARDGWGEDATWFRFECSDYWNQHQHLETGNFEIFRYDQLATESGEYKNWSSPHAVNWLTRTIAHNCLLVAMPGEEWKNYRGGKYFANDGGQAKKWDTVAANLLEWELKKAKFTRGKITAFENTPGFMYVAGDCSKAYSAKKVRKYVRKIVFLRPGVFVILDRVEAVKAEYGKTWLLHCKNEPELKKREFTVKNGEGTLNCYALLPEKTVFNKIKGYTYGGEDFPETESALTEAADLWRVEVKPEGSRSEDIFLNVLSTAGEKKPVLIKKGSAIGVNIDGNEVVFEGEAGGYVLLNNVKYILKEEVIAGKYEK